MRQLRALCGVYWLSYYRGVVGILLSVKHQLIHQGKKTRSCIFWCGQLTLKYFCCSILAQLSACGSSAYTMGMSWTKVTKWKYLPHLSNAVHGMSQMVCHKCTAQMLEMRQWASRFGMSQMYCTAQMLEMSQWARMLGYDSSGFNSDE